MLGVKPVTLLLPGFGLDVVTPTLRAVVSFCDQIFYHKPGTSEQNHKPALGSA